MTSRPPTAAGLPQGCVLLTAAVTPSPALGGALRDPEERLRQYVTAAGNWSAIADSIGLSLAIVETTGFEPDVLRKRLGVPCQVISHTASEADLRRGKGAVEASAIDEALRALTLPRHGLVIKVTGRLRLGNPSALPHRLGANEVMVRRTLDRSYVDTRLLAFSLGAWQDHLQNISTAIDEDAGRFLEHALAHRLTLAEFNHSVVVKRFPRRPLLIGSSGTTGRRYGSRVDHLRALAMNAVETNIQRIGRKQL